MKNKSYIGISFIILLFGIWAVPNIVERIKTGTVVKGDRLNKVDASAKLDEKLVVIGPVPKFTLTDQNNKTISNTDYLNKVYVLEFFFTKCPTICIKMNENMLDIEKTFFGNPNFGVASITIDPKNDTPEVLKEHADFLGITSSHWHMLTGDKDYIYDLANKGFNLYAGEDKADKTNFEHSGMFALIDKKGNIRCRRDNQGNPILYYDGLDAQGINDIKKDIKLLLNE